MKNRYPDVKIYQIDLNHFELHNLNSKAQVVNFISDFHIRNFESEYNVRRDVKRYRLEDVNYTLHVFDEEERESHWKAFFPEELSGESLFVVKHSSFCLFIDVGSLLLVVIGGKGMSMIGRFINPTFGIDVYEKIADPVNDIISFHSSRSISGTLSAEQKTYRGNQRLQDILSFVGLVHKKITFQLRDEIKDTLFDYINFDDSEKVFLQVGTSFGLRWNVSFSQLHSMAKVIENVMTIPSSQRLGRFEKVIDRRFIESVLQEQLLERIRLDINNLRRGLSSERFRGLDADFVHPKKLNEFFQCDEYRVYLKNSTNSIITTKDRTSIYNKFLEYYRNNYSLDDLTNFKRVIGGLRVKGYTNDVEITDSTFLKHLACEIEIDGNSYFLLDNLWYKVKGDFVAALNDQCLNVLKLNALTEDIMDIDWPREINIENEYNNLYSGREGYYVLDKVLSDNIELCDIMFISETSVYLVHVKRGFDAKMRDLTNQVHLSATYLQNDIADGNHKFLKKIYEKSPPNLKNDLSEGEFVNIFKKMQIVYVLAFSAEHHKDVASNIHLHKSNIAKLSLVLLSKVVKESTYELKVVEV